ncbi:spermatogenesis-associated protein 22 [Crotalus adamanteus]|uniref:Spermatogenesis-associated protein 22 n=1 Tax=Crotalus adamanteus TaxID=8729 RepID=A0AAW1CI32_CROAD
MYQKPAALPQASERSRTDAAEDWDPAVSQWPVIPTARFRNLQTQDPSYTFKPSPSQQNALKEKADNLQKSKTIQKKPAGQSKRKEKENSLRILSAVIESMKHWSQYAASYAAPLGSRAQPSKSPERPHNTPSDPPDPQPDALPDLPDLPIQSPNTARILNSPGSREELHWRSASVAKLELSTEGCAAQTMGIGRGGRAPEQYSFVLSDLGGKRGAQNPTGVTPNPLPMPPC